MVRDLLREQRLEATKQALGRTGESIDQAKVFNALKLLANQQGDQDGLIQIIVTNLGKGSRKVFLEGLREFIKIDYERALEVGNLKRGMGTFEVRKPKVPEGCPEVDADWIRSQRYRPWEVT